MTRAIPFAITILLCVVLSATTVDAQRRGRRPRGPEPSPILTSLTSLRCVFEAGATGTWKDGQGKAATLMEASPFVLTLREIDAQGSTAIAGGLGPDTEVTVQLVGSNLHFLDIRPSGALAITTIFSEVSHDGRLKAVHSRSDFGAPGAGGASAAAPDVRQLYGDCEILK